MLLGDNIKRVLVTGGAGFIGSHVVDILMEQGYEVTVFDNLSNGHRSFIDQHFGKPGFTFIEADLMDKARVAAVMPGHDLVWHLAANTDIIGGYARPERDFHDCVEVTFNVLQGIRQHGVRNIIFASSGAVYGDLCQREVVTEASGPLFPVGCYAAAKISCEAFVSAFAHMYNLRAWMFRFGNVVGGRMTHGVIFDFVNKLKANPKELEILGDGTQVKNYFLVEECIEGMAYAFRNVELNEDKPCDTFNLGAATETKVVQIGEIVREELGLKDAKIRIQGEKKAWPGDQTKVHMNVDRVNELGWVTRHTSDEAVREATRRMLAE